MKFSKDQRVDMWNMPVGMYKKVYKEKAKEMDIITSQEEPSQQQHFSNVCNHCLCTYRQKI